MFLMGFPPAACPYAIDFDRWVVFHVVGCFFFIVSWFDFPYLRTVSGRLYNSDSTLSWFGSSAVDCAFLPSFFFFGGGGFTEFPIGNLLRRRTLRCEECSTDHFSATLGEPWRKCGAARQIVRPRSTSPSRPRRSSARRLFATGNWLGAWLRPTYYRALISRSLIA